jgi:4'-phosphopantetheinyl transferase
VLGATLNASPERLQFSSGSHGKPALAAQFMDSALEFNLSHSGDLALIGWAWRRAVGVDIEVWRSVSDEAALARRFFSAREHAAYEALPLTQRMEGFFNCWTRKEAYVKAVGRGLSLPLDSFDVSLEAGRAARLLRASEIANDGRQWSLAAVNVGSGVSVAVVLEGDACHILAPP